MNGHSPYRRLFVETAIDPLSRYHPCVHLHKWNFARPHVKYRVDVSVNDSGRFAEMIDKLADALSYHCKSRARLDRFFLGIVHGRQKVSNPTESEIMVLVVQKSLNISYLQASCTMWRLSPCEMVFESLKMLQALRKICVGVSPENQLLRSYSAKTALIAYAKA